MSTSQRNGDVVLGDDWVVPEYSAGQELQARRARRGFLSLRGSPLTRKIVTFNLIALAILVAGILYLNNSRDSLVRQRAAALVSEARLVANVFEAQLPAGGPVNLAAGDGIDVAATPVSVKVAPPSASVIVSVRSPTAMVISVGALSSSPSVALMCRVRVGAVS